MPAIPFILVTGFLGSGKTTLLKQIVTKNEENRKIGIIQNEFAPVSIDGEDLKDLGKPFELLEINNGSVFCVCLLGDFISSLKIFVEKEQPDLVILESSGLSDPFSISEILQSNHINNRVYLAACWCIIDVGNYYKMQLMRTSVNHQITIADFLVLNKIDQVELNLLKKVKKEVHEINSLAKISETSFCNIDLTEFYNFSGYLKRAKGKTEKSEEGNERPDIIARVFKTRRKISIENLNNLIEKYLKKTKRIKGYVSLDNSRMATVQTVFNNMDIKVNDNKTVDTTLILMGEEFNLSEFSRDFRVLT
jgi:G3E family GTPase